ncbi:hypothetical protein [Sphingomonas sp.]|uniref:hypothetical protein n=1 Tax=Sphingomonas sp. TaxID=28214 RepID=UPI003D6D277D
MRATRAAAAAPNNRTIGGAGTGDGVPPVLPVLPWVLPHRRHQPLEPQPPLLLQLPELVDEELLLLVDAEVDADVDADVEEEVEVEPLLVLVDVEPALVLELVDPPLDVDEMTIPPLPLELPPPKKPPPKKPPPPPKPPPPITAAPPPPPPLIGISPLDPAKATGGRGMGAPWLVTVTTAGGQAARVCVTTRRTLLTGRFTATRRTTRLVTVLVA